MKTRISSAFVTQQTAKAMKAMRSNLRAYKIEVLKVDKNGKVLESEHIYKQDPKTAHGLATKKVDANTKCRVFENAGGEAYVLLAEYAIDPSKLNKISPFQVRMNTIKAVANDVAQGNNHEERWLDAIRNTSVGILIRHRPKAATAA